MVEEVSGSKENRRPFYSIIIPTYNRSKFISRAINSVLDQTFSDWEIILVDDGSTDNTRDVISLFDDERIKYLYQENSERSVARNNGIKNSNGEWICFLDSDDYYLPNHLESFYIFISKEKVNKCFIVNGGYEEIKKKLIERTLFDSNTNEHPANFILRNTNITPISVCIHNSCFDTQLFPEKLKKAYWEDTHLWLRLSILFPFYQLNDFTSVLTEHPGRSINTKIDRNRVSDHIKMIEDLYLNYYEILEPIISKKTIKNYVDKKYRMFLYTARQNKQICISLLIWWNGIIHMPSWYLITELPKIFLNRLNIGLHER